MAVSLRETCQQYFDRRIREGWKCVSRDGPLAVLLSPDGVRKEMDLRNDVETLRPNGTSSSEEDSSGGSYTEIDEVVADEDVTKVSVSDETVDDAWALENHSAGSGTINSVAVYFRGRWQYKTGGWMRAEIYFNFSFYRGDSETLTESYVTYNHVWSQNPNTSAAWTWDDIDALKAGIQMYSVAQAYTHCTQVYVEVDYTPAASSSIEADGPVAQVDIEAITGVVNADVETVAGVSNTS